MVSGCKRKGVDLVEKAVVIGKLDEGASVAALAKEHGHPPQSIAQYDKKRRNSKEAA